jgi:hypothetical protein
MFHAFLFSYIFVFKTDCQTHADNFQTRFFVLETENVSKTGYQTGSNFSLSYDYLTSCLSNISKILGLVTARKGH